MEKNSHKVSSPKQNRKTKNKLNNWAKYSGLSVQLVVTILLGFFGGLKLDEFLQWKFPLFTIVFSLLAIFMSLWLFIKDFLK